MFLFLILFPHSSLPFFLASFSLLLCPGAGCLGERGPDLWFLSLKHHRAETNALRPQVGTLWAATIETEVHDLANPCFESAFPGVKSIGMCSEFSCAVLLFLLRVRLLILLAFATSNVSCILFTRPLAFFFGGGGFLLICTLIDVCLGLDGSTGMPLFRVDFGHQAGAACLRRGVCPYVGCRHCCAQASLPRMLRVSLGFASWGPTWGSQRWELC